MSIGIYKIENLLNGKVYIGQQVDIFGHLHKILTQQNDLKGGQYNG